MNETEIIHNFFHTRFSLREFVAYGKRNINRESNVNFEFKICFLGK